MGLDQRHYNIEKLNKIFALVSFLLLFCLIGLFGKDYSREWKKYQQEFHELDIEKTRVKDDSSTNELKNNSEYQTLLQNYDKAQKESATKCVPSKSTEDELNALKAHDDVIQQQYKFTKAELDAARYRYETAKAEKAQNAMEAEKEFAQLDQKVRDLKTAVDQSQTELSQKERTQDNCLAELKKLEAEDRRLSSKEDILKRKLKNIDPNEMNFTNQIADMVRDLPFIDLANPKFKIKQIVLKDIRDDVNFVTVPKVDRCITCHLGISNPDYRDAPQPFTTHPNLELYLGKDSPHPLDEFGCTVCHGGRGRSTNFTGAVHIPSSTEEQKIWEKKYHWHKVELWGDPMLPMPYVEAGCFKCHSGETTIKGADKLNLGLNIIEKAGCYGCHTIDKYKDWPKPGPDLTHIASKLSKDWIYKWIADPRSFRRDTWMPSFFNQSNTKDSESTKRTDSKKRNQQEVHAMTHYLLASSEKLDLQNIPVKGDPKNGEELVASIGCLACHRITPAPENEPTTQASLRQEQGPNLLGLGSKTSEQWLYNWLKNPSRYHSQTRMPNFRLSDQEASDIATYLSLDRNKIFEEQGIPAVDEKVVNDILLEFLTTTESHESAEKALGSMDPDQKLALAGEKLIGNYGCFSCHDIKGFEKTKPIGIDLTEEGSKSPHKLDFGFVDIDHSAEAWFTQKLKNPRIFDQGKIKSPYEKLKMPNFNLSQDEIEAVVTALLGFTKENAVENKKMAKTPENLMIEQGEKLVRQFNCQACHIIEGSGGAIQKSVEDWLIKYQGRSESEAKALITNFSPPNLLGEGQKVQAQWLFEFLHHPTPIRPWLKVRMPTYNFNVSNLNSLIKYFNALDHQEFPFTEEVDTSLSPEEYLMAEKLFSNDYFGCAQCHIVGDKMPNGGQDSWAPNFALAKERLKPNWISQWLKNPQDLLPGTKMPTYFDPQNFDSSGPEDIADGNELEQIRLLRNYLMTLSGTHQESKKSSEENKGTPKEQETPVSSETTTPATQ